MSFFAHKHSVIVLRVAVGHSDGMREGGHQIGSPFCKDMVKTASFFFNLSFDRTAFLNVLKSSELGQNRVQSRFQIFCKVIFGILLSRLMFNLRPLVCVEAIPNVQTEYFRWLKKRRYHTH